MSQLRGCINLFSSMFVARSGPKIPDVAGSFVVVVSSQSDWAPFKTVGIMQEEEHDASF